MKIFLTTVTQGVLRIGTVSLSLLFSCALVAQASLPSAADVEKDIKAFAKEMAEQHQFDQTALEEKLLAMQPRADIIARISKPAESMPWHRYRKIFIQDKRINQGVEFWSKHADTLARAEETFGVDASIIVAIIGVETFYGRIQGSFPVVEALHTLGFYYPKRAKFFRSELGEFYRLARAQNWKLDEIKGSYAGAMGMGQFISSSYRHYGVDFNADGKVNLFDDTVDMIGSVANYFSRFKWQLNGVVAQPIMLTEKQKELVQSSLKLKHSLADLQSAGVDVAALEERSKKAGIFAFELANGQQQYWLVGDNFYTITRYNHSALYALAVFELSQAIVAEKQKQQ
ncbi:lytic murein transglycosylase B [Aliikangiella sp. IMCC44632]